ncbi:hypothetical protein [Leptospira sarikeiensis]|uniref:Uncharacterized protein n=1 Tax=Leptospira sarikeiensis TaxID=2484943 RepID=A0A4R9K0H1_9LEPT|nr:hypothetical protein [Leptospira sarikeiensis]TGL58506.1 hypothetical protein EHQ64_18525 [Leptospira sarikeiensis]
MNTINWKNEIHKQLKKSGGYREDGYSFGIGSASQLLHSLLGIKNIHSAVDYYLSGDIIALPIGDILKLLRSEEATDYCIQKLYSPKSKDYKPDVLRLLKDICHPKSFSVVEPFLFNEDPSVEYQAAYLFDMLMFGSWLDEEDYLPILKKMKNHPNQAVKETYKSIKKSLRLRNSCFYSSLNSINTFFWHIFHKFEEIRLIGFRKSFSEDNLQEYLKAMAEESKNKN